MRRGWLRDGSEDRDELRREQLGEEDLTHLLRLEGIYDRNDVPPRAG